MADLGLLKLLLPDYFEVIDYKSEGDELHLFVEEKNNPPQEYAKDKLSSKGFHDEVVVQDNSQYGFLWHVLAYHMLFQCKVFTLKKYRIIPKIIIQNSLP